MFIEEFGRCAKCIKTMRNYGANSIEKSSNWQKVILFVSYNIMMISSDLTRREGVAF